MSNSDRFWLSIIGGFLIIWNIHLIKHFDGDISECVMCWLAVVFDAIIAVVLAFVFIELFNNWINRQNL